MKTKNKLTLLRGLMKKHKIDLYIVPSSDPHISEYLPDYWKSRSWISGFTGSAGTFAITQEKAALWTDSRYFLQAEKELANSSIELCKQGLPETPSLENWITMQLGKGDVVGIDGRVFQVSLAKNIVEQLHKGGIKCKSDVDLISPIWDLRPKLPTNKVFIQELQYTGKNVSEKIGEVRKQMKLKGITSYLICALDEVNWLFNIRGNDINYNPVVLSYGFIDNNQAILFIDTNKIDENIANQLHEQGVTTKSYEKVEKFISNLDKK